MNVYALSARSLPEDDWDDWADRTSRLGDRVAELAAARGEAIFFHRLLEEADGAPLVLVECSEAFLAALRALPEFGEVSETLTEGESERG